MLSPVYRAGARITAVGPIPPNGKYKLLPVFKLKRPLVVKKLLFYYVLTVVTVVMVEPLGRESERYPHLFITTVTT
jgi:hypothetical protein